MTTMQAVLDGISALSTDELVTLNGLVVDLITARRRLADRVGLASLHVGQAVRYTGSDRRIPAGSLGTVMEIRKTRAAVRFDKFPLKTWNVCGSNLQPEV